MTGGALLVATRSGAKLRELRPLLLQAGFEPLDLTDVGIVPAAAEDAIEAFETFEDNAMAKARYFHRLSGLPTIADDSGLEVDALGGAPGVHSKRWSAGSDLAGQLLDDANNRLLLSALSPFASRAARYVCAAAFASEQWELASRGETTGEITQVARGNMGFGYDPYFWSRDLGATFGESLLEAKARVSHRARAIRALLSEIAKGR